MAGPVRSLLILLTVLLCGTHVNKAARYPSYYRSYTPARYSYSSYYRAYSYRAYTYRAYTYRTYTYRAYSTYRAYAYRAYTYRAYTYRSYGNTYRSSYQPYNAYARYSRAYGSWSRYYYYYYYYHMYFTYPYQTGYYAYRNTKPGATVCKNYEAISNGSYLGSFTCPMPFEPSTFTACCGDSNAEYCCKGESLSGGAIAGIVLGSLLALALLILIIIAIAKCSTRPAAVIQPQPQRTVVHQTNHVYNGAAHAHAQPQVWHTQQQQQQQSYLPAHAQPPPGHFLPPPYTPRPPAYSPSAPPPLAQPAPPGFQTQPLQPHYPPTG